MKTRMAKLFGVSAFVVSGAVLSCAYGCGQAPKPAPQAVATAEAMPAPAAPAAAVPPTTEDAQMHALIAQRAPEGPPAAQVQQAAPVKESGQSTAGPTADAHQAGTTYVVRHGDTLSGISEKYYGTQANWKLILDANASVLKTPKSLRPGMKLVIPPAKTPPARLAAAHSASGAKPAP
jgi:nucleoid-associated protein YgaU